MRAASYATGIIDDGDFAWRGIASLLILPVADTAPGRNTIDFISWLQPLHSVAPLLPVGWRFDDA